MKFKIVAAAVIISLLFGLIFTNLSWRGAQRSSIHVAITNFSTSETTQVSESASGYKMIYIWNLWNSHSQQVWYSNDDQEIGPFEIYRLYQNGTKQMVYTNDNECADGFGSFTLIDLGLTKKIYVNDFDVYPFYIDGFYQLVPLLSECSASQPSFLTQYSAIIVAESNITTFTEPLLPNNFGKINHQGRNWLLIGFALILLPLNNNLMNRIANTVKQEISLEDDLSQKK
ncbi:MAG: hypothetical protein GPJ54_21125 [Candidatus Heimdallarchaeota archaeon]|nr:hypothetical protein [Candidatus Heimdallarchaeota archaeon]